MSVDRLRGTGLGDSQQISKKPATSFQLNSVYEQIRKSVGYDTVPRDMTVWFMGLGLVMLVLTSGAALVWSERIP